MNVRIYTRAATETEAGDRNAEMMVWCGEHDHHVRECTWDGLAGQRGLMKTLRGASKDTLIVVWTIADLARGELNALVKQIQTLTAEGVWIFVYTTKLWFSPESREETAVINALCAAHLTYVSENRRLGMASARAAGATIGRPTVFTLDNTTRNIITAMTEQNGGRLPSTRKLAKRIGCGATKAFELLREWKADDRVHERTAEAE